MPGWAWRAADALLVGVAAAIPLSTTGMQVGVLALGALTVGALIARWPVVRATPLDGVLGLFYGVLACSTLASGHPFDAGGWHRLWVVVAYFVVFWWLRDRAQVVRLARILVVVAGLTAAYGILQHYTGADWYRTLLGRPTQVRPPAPGATGYAVVGFFGNYLTFAHTMLFPLALAAAQALQGIALGLVAAPLLIVALVFSTARGAWLAILPMAAALAATARARRTGWTLVALAAAATAAFAASPDLRARAAATFATGGVNTGRMGIYRANRDIVREHPVLGLGFGRYKKAAVPYYEAHPEADRRSHAHSNYLHIAAEAGLVGLAAFGLVVGTALLRGWAAVARAPDAATRAAAGGAWAAIVGFLAGGVTQYTFGDNEVALTMWVTLALLMRLREP